jgi:hypothetical protein
LFSAQQLERFSSPTVEHGPNIATPRMLVSAQRWQYLAIDGIDTLLSWMFDIYCKSWLLSRFSTTIDDIDAFINVVGLLLWTMYSHLMQRS